MALGDELAAKATAIRAGTRRAYDMNRQRTNIAPAARQVLDAKAYVEAQRQLNELSASNKDSQTARFRAVSPKVYGIAGLPDAASGSATIAFRDAQDRVAATKGDIGELSRLQQQAQRSGDAYMERAVAARALDGVRAPLVGDQYLALLNKHIERHPGEESSWQEAVDLTAGGSAGDLMAEATQLNPSKSPSLDHLKDHQIASLARLDPEQIPHDAPAI